ncbi:hypothetical protein CYMTET_2843 [Cymbomonas tetramitiformis]|uniref:Uncharacterized protein n=1 Tax=Cymbomonas tetramitiformis TaxID=36881 RepID=A0AAE0LM44_9CHLO|nr:hypothetical protein CYMTET_2843 [Cymbomonas tetramitiformis]|eukprot:gene1637-2281_t
MNPSACVFDPCGAYANTLSSRANSKNCEGCIYLRGQIEVLREMLGLPPTFVVQRPFVHEADAAARTTIPAPRREIAGDESNAYKDEPAITKRTAHAETQTREEKTIQRKRAISHVAKSAQTTRVMEVHATTLTENLTTNDHDTQTSIAQCVSVACGDDIVEDNVVRSVRVNDDQTQRCRFFFRWAIATATTDNKKRERAREALRSVIREVAMHTSRIRRCFATWFARILDRARAEYRLGKTLATWRKMLTYQRLIRLENREQEVQLLSDEYHMAIERNKDLTHLNEMLSLEADDMSGKAQDMQHTITELGRRLRISGDCIKSMQKGFEVKCNACHKRLLRFNSTATDTDVAMCAIEALEDFENEEDNQKLVQFTNAHLTHAVSAKLFP